MGNQTLSCSIIFMKHITRTILTLSLTLIYVTGFAQPGAEIEVNNKPTKYENRKLRAEKTGEKKLTLPKRVLQNTITHYNYYFNANNRLNEVISRAKASNKDDYSQLLPFYNYSLDVTSQDKTELDSIIYKSTAGILLHDLRNDWIDNMYLILAKAYFFRKDLDSAGLTLQYINFAFAPKEGGGYDIPIGSNASNETGEFSIASKENKGVKKLIKHQPSRNEAFLWQVRNFVERDEMPEAAGIIEILRNDPNFPKRLKTDLYQTMSYWFYKQKVYDSSAYYLSKSLNEADNGQEKARWEYLIAQMYQLANNNDLAVEYYDKSIRHTNDAVMDVYARLNSIRINKSDKKDYLQDNIDALVKMAKRDKYENYRDIIYYAAASIELERSKYDPAQNFLLKSVEFSNNNPVQKSQSFLLLGDLNYNRKSYPAAASYYDSVDVNSLASQEDKDRVTLRKPPLKILADNAVIIYNNDSIQALAKMPEDQRDAVLRKVAKQLRKEQGLKEDKNDVLSSNPAVKQQATDLFDKSNKGNDFYFYNASAKATGFNEFKAKWGDRPNIDNWRRQTAVNRRSFITGAGDVDKPIKTPTDKKEPDNSFESLLMSLPLTQEKMGASNKAIADALYANAKTLTDKLEDYPSAILVYEELLRRFPNTEYKEEALFNLVYAYEKTGDKLKADAYRKELLQSSPSNPWVNQIKNPTTSKFTPKQKAATKKYEDIYNMFIEGRFAEALTEKKAADSVYGKSYWTPQLLFIEAIYYVKEKQDSAAIKVLTDLSTAYASNPLAAKAKTMIDVLKRRSEIETYLTNLNTPATADKPANTTPVTTNQPAAVNNPPQKTDKPAQSVTTNVPVNKKDTTAGKPVAIQNFKFVAIDPQYVAVLLDKVDEVYASEARNAFNRFNREKYYNQKIDMTSAKVDAQYNLVLQGPFTDAAAAMDYIDKVKPVTPGRILPWLAADKYSFLIISNTNLEALKANKDVSGYKQLLKQTFPGKF
jgi:outer membrane protein assembly factor BamD (BamD/ComL family)